MPEVIRTIEIAAPPSAVWRWMATQEALLLLEQVDRTRPQLGDAAVAGPLQRHPADPRPRAARQASDEGLELLARSADVARSLVGSPATTSRHRVPRCGGSVAW